MLDKTILVVEDELMIAEDIQESLADMGYQVIGTAASGPDALHKVREFYPSLVLMDIMLKGQWDGIQTAETIQKEHDCAIIYLTAYTDQKMLQRAKITSPFGYILKPFREKELHAMVEISLYRHEMERQNREQQQLILDTLLQSPEAIIVVNTEGRVQFINPATECLVGMESSDVLQREVQEVFHFQDLEQQPFQLETLLKDKVPHRHVHMQLSDGRLLNLRLGGSEIQKPGATSGGYILTLVAEQPGVAASQQPDDKGETELFAICASCKNVRTEEGHFVAMEQFFRERFALRFTHGICPACFESLYPDYFLDPPDSSPSS